VRSTIFILLPHDKLVTLKCLCLTQSFLPLIWVSVVINSPSVLCNQASALKTLDVKLLIQMATDFFLNRHKMELSSIR
jgi:hypothetical protein